MLYCIGSRSCEVTNYTYSVLILLSRYQNYWLYESFLYSTNTTDTSRASLCVVVLVCSRRVVIPGNDLCVTLGVLQLSALSSCTHLSLERARAPFLSPSHPSSCWVVQQRCGSLREHQLPSRFAADLKIKRPGPSFISPVLVLQEILRLLLLLCDILSIS